MWSDSIAVKEGVVASKDGKGKLGRNKWKGRHVRIVQDYLLLYKHKEDNEPSKVHLFN